MIRTESVQGTSPGTLEVAEMSRKNPCLTRGHSRGPGGAGIGGCGMDLSRPP